MNRASRKPVSRAKIQRGITAGKKFPNNMAEIGSVTKLEILKAKVSWNLGNLNKARKPEFSWKKLLSSPKSRAVFDSLRF